MESRARTPTIFAIGLLFGVWAPVVPAWANPELVLSSPGTLPPITRQTVDVVKVAVAAATTCLLAWRLIRQRRGTQVSWRWDVALATLGVAGAACFWNLFQFHHPGYGHPHDNFHYYFGSKYFPELGYQRLYPCTVVADHEAGLRRSGHGGRYRDLSENKIVSARVILDDPNACKQHFSSERWREYTTDLDWMRARLPSGKWRNLLMDHGYNATPVWGVVGGLLTDSQSLSRSQLRILTLIDPAMLVIMWLAVTWAFGWRSACVGIVFWGTNDFAGFEWVGGGILRQDWLVASVVGICFLRRNHPVAGGFLLGWATLLRIFPGCLLLGLALHAATFAWKVGIKELRKTHLPIALGAGLSVALMVPLSGALMGRADSVGDDARGLAVWADFAENARVHLATPLPNHIGLQTLIAYDPAQTARETRDIRKEDPFEDWKRMRRETRDQRSGLLVVLTVGFLMLFTGSVRRGSTWEVAIVSIGIIPFATELTNYYYAILIAYAGLWGVRQEIGLGLVALGLLSWGLVDWFHYYDEIFTAASAAILVFVLFATIRMPNPKNSRTPSQAL